MGAVRRTTVNHDAATPRTLLLRLAISLALVPLSVGCATSRPAWLEQRGVALDPRPARPADQVEVWLDDLPARDIVVVADLEGRGVDSTSSIRKMQERAALAGLDGIYWIECTGPGARSCVARGFVYDRGAIAPPVNLASR